VAPVGPLMPKGGKLLSLSVDPALRKAWTRPGSMAALVVVAILVALSFFADLRWDEPLAPVALVSVIVIGPISAALYTWLEGLFGRRVATAYAVLTAASEPIRARWRDEIGGRYPRTVAEAEQWLAKHSPSPQTDWARANILVRMGRVADARDVISRLPSQTALDQLYRADAMNELAVIERRPVDLTPFAKIEAMGGLVGTEAHTLMTQYRAMAAVDASGDWMAIVLEDQSLMGEQVDRNLRDRFFKATLKRSWQFTLGLLAANLLLAVLPAPGP
jgi:hypothetical protein